MHIQRRHGNRRPVASQQIALRPASFYGAEYHMLSATCIALVAQVGSKIARAISNERHDAVNKPRTDDLAAFARLGHGVILLIQKLAITIGRPDVVVMRFLAFRRQHKLLAMTIAGEILAVEDLLRPLAIVVVYVFRLDNNAQYIFRRRVAAASKVANRSLAISGVRCPVVAINEVNKEIRTKAKRLSPSSNRYLITRRPKHHQGDSLPLLLPLPRIRGAQLPLRDC